MKLFGITVFGTREVIAGCEKRGDQGVAYLTRYPLLERPGQAGFALYLHIFHRSDSDHLHDHPWDFSTLILWRGYREDFYLKKPFPLFGSRDVRPGQRLYRPATFRHRVRLYKDRAGRERPAITLVWTGPKVREWGFWHSGALMPSKEYFEKWGCK